jgi:hypothetical protein
MQLSSSSEGASRLAPISRRASTADRSQGSVMGEAFKVHPVNIWHETRPNVPPQSALYGSFTISRYRLAERRAGTLRSAGPDGDNTHNGRD